MKTIGQLEKEIMETQYKIDPLASKLAALQQELKREKARVFIANNGITLAEVELSDGDGKPYFGHIQPFIEWLRANSKKNWAEWNTTIYRMSDLLNERMPHDMPATIGDLK